jgi:hypothetical protein
MEIYIADTTGTREIWAVRDDDVAVGVSDKADPASLPHELFHYVVEDALGLAWGYWDCIARGALFPGMRVRSGMAEPDAMARSGRVGAEAGPRADEAEFFVAAVETTFDAGLERDVTAARDLVRTQWPHLTCPPLETVDLPALKLLVQEMTGRWRELPEGVTVTLPWPTPAAGRLRHAPVATPPA